MQTIHLVFKKLPRLCLIFKNLQLPNKLNLKTHVLEIFLLVLNIYCKSDKINFLSSKNRRDTHYQTKLYLLFFLGTCFLLSFELKFKIKQCCGASGAAIILRIQSRSRNSLFNKHIDCTKVRLEAARINKNSFLPPMRQISYFAIVEVHFNIGLEMELEPEPK